MHYLSVLKGTEIIPKRYGIHSNSLHVKDLLSPDKPPLNLHSYFITTCFEVKKTMNMRAQYVLEQKQEQGCTGLVLGVDKN